MKVKGNGTSLEFNSNTTSQKVKLCFSYVLSIGNISVFLGVPFVVLIAGREVLFYMLWTDSLKRDGGLVTELCPTLCDPKDCSLSGSSVHGIL